MQARLHTYRGMQPHDVVEISSKNNPHFDDQLRQLVNDYNASAEKNHVAQMFIDRLGPEGVAKYLDSGEYVCENLTNLGTVQEGLLFDEDVVAVLADHADKGQREKLDQLAYDVNAHMEPHSYVKDEQGNIRREFDREPGIDSRLALVLPADGGSPYVEARYYDKDGTPQFDVRPLDDPATAKDEFNEVAHEYTLAAQGREFADAAPVRDDAGDMSRHISVAERVQRVQSAMLDASKHNDAGFTKW